MAVPLPIQEWWVDGHFITAPNPTAALVETYRLYRHVAETVRPWTTEDQAELDNEEN